MSKLSTKVKCLNLVKKYRGDAYVDVYVSRYKNGDK